MWETILQSFYNGMLLLLKQRALYHSNPVIKAERCFMCYDHFSSDIYDNYPDFAQLNKFDIWKELS
ncbi:hypothetical protein CHS0354_014858 [Potamilus streckersoni]|uniref:Uncharacterized protein n=1 Tax=Potamilus streckersoni TaxID=2493646 RepID=A0AAE0VGG6_9BIVA|nr:hypothetical protein CHS0354_014858 [Potamilus streckersoni]